MKIAFEGIDGAGKTSAINSVKKHFINAGFKVSTVTFPSKSLYGEKVIKLLKSENPDQKEIAKAFVEDFNNFANNYSYNKNEIVIFDRSPWSFLAYQINFLDDYLFRKIRESIKFIKMDCVLLIDLDPNLSLSRIKRKKDAIENSGIETMSAIRSSFRKLAKENKKIFFTVDGARSQDEVFEDCVELIDSKIRSISTLKMFPRDHRLQIGLLYYHINEEVKKLIA